MMNVLLYLSMFLIKSWIAFAESKVNICSNVRDGIFLADLNDCNGYHVCMNQTAYSQKCADGLHFTAKTQRCDHPSVSECVTQCTKSLMSFAYDKTCTKYVLCFAKQAIIRECRDGLQYNAETDRCDYASNVDCRENMCNSVNDPNDLTFLPSQAACDKYYLCYNGEPVPQNCSNGLYFDAASGNCDFKSNVRCTVNANKRTVLPFSRMPPTRADITCPKKGAHFFAHSNPEKYYFCVDGDGVILSCTPGLLYDKETESCRDQKNIK